MPYRIFLSFLGCLVAASLHAGEPVLRNWPYTPPTSTSTLTATGNRYGPSDVCRWHHPRRHGEVQTQLKQARLVKLEKSPVSVKDGATEMKISFAGRDVSCRWSSKTRAAGSAGQFQTGHDAGVHESGM